MASTKDIAQRYAGAWLDAAVEKDLLAAVRSEIKVLEDLYRNSEAFLEFLTDKSIPGEIKQRILGEIFETKVQGITLNFLFLLVSRSRERFLPEILESCRVILDEWDGVVNAYVSSAVALSSLQEGDLKTGLEAYTGKTVRMKTTVDADLIGGFVVRVGDQVFDSSLTTQLQRVRQSLVG
mgnify:CR=1 FL=1